MTLHPQIEEQRAARRLTAWTSARRELRQALSDLLPDGEVWVFGSLTKPGVFNDASDVDIALAGPPPGGLSIFVLASMLEERLRRPVDMVLLNESRLKHKILREGERWTKSD